LNRIETITAAAWASKPTVTERVAEIYLAHRDEVFRFLVAQGLPAANAQDVTQEVFLKLFVTLRDGVEVASEQAWLYRVAANRAVDYWRRERRIVRVELDAASPVAETLESHDVRVDRLAEQEQRMRLLAAEIGRLPKEHRMCVLLRAQGLTYRDIARILNIGVSTAADWLLAAVERLRRCAGGGGRP
jgi:RNA polymerase sigma-70 factor (ECF subfamily)